MSEKIQRITREILPAIGYGDAAGVPVETKHAEAIQARHGYLDQLVASDDNPFFKGEWPAGTTSDDTQLSVAVAESLMAAGGFSLADQARRHIEAYHETPHVQTATRTITRGWGRSTTESVTRLIDGVSPAESGHPRGAGNGIVMKMAPLALWQVAQGVDQSERYEQHDQLTTMTHDSDMARACTRLHGDVLAAIVEESSVEALPDVVLRHTATMAHDFPDEAALLARAVTRPCATFDELARRYAEGKTGFQYGFYVPETLAMTYDIALGAGGDMQTAVYRAVNLGGDADSTASIVAAMMVAAEGGMPRPPHDLDRVQDIDRLRAISARLAATAMGGESH